ncbi:MAG: radical SAM protein [Desulfovibrionaceae bacterium]|nr:radical SAM protein [Desulfovibrionaceae bacterium]MBF0512513.1 radical SAM protein [Desulfovibrionaceae bacterium]
MAAASPTKLNYVFGPILSGRLGRSLGLDLLGARICSFDCLYCEAGPTDKKTVTRAVYVKPDAILAELAAHKAIDPSPVDAVTLGGLGEPCLNEGIGEIIAGAKSIYPATPVAVLTNSSLLWLDAAREDIMGADIVLPSLDSLAPSEFARLNRPCPEITLEMVKDGLVRFREQFSGRIYLEVLLADGLNDSIENLEALLQFRRLCRPDRIDVVTLSRPGAYPEAKPVRARTLEDFRRTLGAEQIPCVPSGHGPPGLMPARAPSTLEAAVLGSLRRRPQTASQLVLAMGKTDEELARVLGALESQGRIAAQKQLGAIFYSLAGS